MRILLVQTAFLGDVILSAPVIDAIKSRYPDSELFLLTTSGGAEIYKFDPRLKEIIVFDKRGSFSGLSGLFRFSSLLRKYGFDKAYSLHKSFRTALVLWLSGIRTRVGFSKASLAFLYNQLVKVPENVHQVQRNLKLVSSDLADFKIYTAAEFENKDLLSDFSNYVLISPGSVWATKRWHWQGFKKVSDYLQSLGYTVLLIGSSAEYELASMVKGDSKAVNLAGKISLADTVRLVSNSKLMLVNDSMALHLSSAFKIPVVAVFCATSPDFGFGPWQNDKAIVVEEQGLECKPCARHGSNKCPTGTEACMKLSADKVIVSVNKLIN